MGCVCDFDVPCPTHKEGRWIEPRLTGDCIEFGHLFTDWTEDADGMVTTFETNDCIACGGTRYFVVATFGDAPEEQEPAVKAPETHKQFYRRMVAEIRRETGATKQQAEYQMECYMGSGDCQCEECVSHHQAW